jgi:hypothetical protein
MSMHQVVGLLAQMFCQFLCKLRAQAPLDEAIKQRANDYSGSLGKRSKKSFL